MEQHIRIIAFFLFLGANYLLGQTVDGSRIIDSTGRVLYEVIQGGFTWEAARDDAESRGGHLAVVTSEEENNLLKLIINGHWNNWIGASDMDGDGQWEWVTGEPFNYTNWYGGEPNNQGGEEYYLQMYGNGQWNDISEGSMQYIIEYEPPSIEEWIDRDLLAYYPLDGHLGNAHGPFGDLDGVGASFRSTRSYGDLSLALDEQSIIKLENDKFPSNFSAYTINFSYRYDEGAPSGTKLFSESSQIVGNAGICYYIQQNLNPDAGLETLHVAIWNRDVPNNWSHSSFDMPLAFGQWRHLVLSHEANGQLNLIIDGALVGSRTLPLPLDRVGNTNGHFLIGGNVDDFENRDSGFVGDMNAIRLYGRALSYQEAVALYEQDAAMPHWANHGLLAHYPFDGTLVNAYGSFEALEGENHGYSFLATTKRGDWSLSTVEDSVVLSQEKTLVTNAEAYSISLSYQYDEGASLDCFLYSESANPHGATGIIYGVESKLSIESGIERLVVSTWNNDVSGNWSGVEFKLPIEFGQWKHITLTHDRDDRLSLYVDGEWFDTQTIAHVTNNQSDEGHIRIGGNADDVENNQGRNFIGEMNSLRLYNRALSSLEAKKNFLADTGKGKERTPPLMEWLDDELLAYYPFAGNAQDASGHGHHGEDNGAGLAADRFGREQHAYQFDGVDDFISVPHAPSLTSFPFTVSLWVYNEETQSEAGIIGKYTAASWQGWQIHQTGGEVYPWYIRDTGNLVIGDYGYEDNPSFHAPIDLGAWEHVVFSVSEEAGRIYINGRLADQQPWIGEPGISSESLPLIMGKYANASGGFSSYLKGMLDDVRLYGSALTSAQVEQLYRYESLPALDGAWINDGLVAHYPFDGNAQDVSGNAHHGEVHGATQTTDRFGREQSAYQFDGVDDFISVAHAPALSSYPFSASLWIHNDAAGTGGGLIGKYSAASWNGWQLVHDYEENITPWYIINSGNAIIGDYQNQFPDNPSFKAPIGLSQWEHILFTVDAEGGFLYINGELAAHHEWIGGAGPTGDSWPLIFGKYVGYIYGHYSGKIDDVRIYNRSLSDKEVLLLYEKESGIPSFEDWADEGLIAYYPFDGDWKDASENANHLTSDGAVLGSDRFGNTDRAAKLNQNSHLSAGDTYLPKGDESRTISLWAKRDGTPYLLGEDLYTGILFSSGNSGVSGDFGDTWIEMWYPKDGDNDWGVRYVGNPDAYLHTYWNAGSSGWVHICYTFQDGLLKMYADGRYLGERSAVDFHPDKIGNFYLGSATGDKGFSGYIDDVRIYNRALSSSEVSQLYSLEASVSPGDPSCSITQVQFPPIPNIDFDAGIGGVVSLILNASVLDEAGNDVPLPIIYEIVEGNGLFLEGSVLSVTQPGGVVIRARVAGTDQWCSSEATRSFTVIGDPVVNPPIDPDAVAVYPEAVSGAVGATINVPFVVKNFEGISGLQTTIAWDPSIMELVTQTNSETGSEEVVVTDSAGYMKTVTIAGQQYQYEEPFFKGSNFVFVNDSATGEQIDGIVAFLWSETEIPNIGRIVEDDDTLFALQFRLIGSAGDVGQVELVDDPTPYLVAPASGEDIAETTQPGMVTIINQIPVSGTVFMGGHSDRPVINVKVELEQDGATSEQLTNASGAFSYTLDSDSSISLFASKTDRSKASRSVDVSDIVAMRKHILAMERLSSVSAMIAADATRDASIDVADIVAMQKVILAMSDSFSVDGDGNAQPVWRILDAAVLNNATTENVFGGVLDGAETIAYSGLTGAIEDANFVAIKLGDANQDWSPDSSEAQTTLGAREELQVSDIIRLNAPQTHADGSITIDVHAQATQGLVGMQFGLNWDRQILQLEGMTAHQLPGFSQQAHSHAKQGSAMVAWTDAMVRGIDTHAEGPVMTLHFTLLPGADRGTSIQLTQPLLVGSQGSERAAMGVASYYHLEGGTMLSSQGLIRSMHRSEGSLSLEFATQEGMSYVVESTQDLATGQWEAVTTVEGSGRHEVIEMPTTVHTQSYLRVREASGVPQ